MSLLAFLTDILYIGHSLIGPSLPPLVEAGLAHQGMKVEVSAQVINGAPLRYGWENSADGERADARVLLPRAKTKVLVLTEALPLAAQIEWNDSAGYVAKFADLAWRARPDTQVYIYETWHSLKSGPGTEIEGDTGSSVPWRKRLTADLPAWESLMAKANAERPQGAPMVRLIPAGQAMGRLADAIDQGRVPDVASIDQLFDDDIHPGDQLLYFVALVHIAVISGENPTGLPARLGRHWISREAVISDEQAAVFQRIAWEAVQAYQADDIARLTGLVQQPVEAVEPIVVLPMQEVATAPAVEATPAPAASTDLMTGVTNPRLSLGLAGIHDWSVQQPFLDVMKTARPWVGHQPGEWGGFEFEALGAGGYLDARGWPRAIPPEVAEISTLVLTDFPENTGKVAGRYVLRYNGVGTLKVGGRAVVVEQAPGRVVFEYTPGPGGVSVTLSALDPHEPVHEITIVREDRLTAHDAGAIFNPDWLNRIRGVQGVRFMDWMATNDSMLATLSDRPMTEDFSWAVNGVPIEVMLALANELKSDAWFTIPHLADDALVRFYAEAARDGLAPGLKAQVEYSNEVWNWQFAQAGWADKQCQARWQVADCWVQYYALRAAEVADIWSEVFGDQAGERLTRVIATQTGWIGLEEQILDAPLVLAEGRNSPVESFDAYAVTGYFSAGLGGDDKVKLLRSWLKDSMNLAEAQADQQGLMGVMRDDYVAAHRFDLANERAAIELQTGFVSGETANSMVDLLTNVLPYHAGVAENRGLRLMMYEGGTHVVATGELLGDDDITAFFNQLNYTPQMAVLYERLLQGWAALTDAPFNGFIDVYAPNKWGSWGGLRHLGDQNLRWQVMAHGCRTC